MKTKANESKFRQLLICIIFLMCVSSAMAADVMDLAISYSDKAPAGLVGNGKIIARVTSGGFEFIKAKEKIAGKFIFKKHDKKIESGPTSKSSVFVPGAVLYKLGFKDGNIEVLHGGIKDAAYIAAFKLGKDFDVQIDLSGKGQLYRQEREVGGGKIIIYSTSKDFGVYSFERLLAMVQEPYKKGLSLKSPSKNLNRAVAFSKFLLELGYDGNLMVCEIFRWRDIWARDLGSGLLPGALVSGQIQAGVKSLDYDLGRYSLCQPQDSKNSNDASQGGTATGVAWTANSIWQYYLYSGDKDYLYNAAKIIRPWVAHWGKKDYNEDGLIMDATEFMDHMVMMLSTNGVMTLAANSMYASMFSYFSKIENELGNTAEGDRLYKLYLRTDSAINEKYWDEEKGYYYNLLLWDLPDKRSSQASQAMYLKVNAAKSDRAKRTLDYLNEHNLRKAGSVTITPAMLHVSMDNDQNVKIWPWWNLWQSQAHYMYGDPDDGYRLLDLAAGTILVDKYPGLIEENLTEMGQTYGGNAFVTAAGNLLAVVVQDMLGVKVVKAGFKEIAITPKVPATWKNYSATIPTINGYITVNYNDGKLKVDVRDNTIEKIYVDSDTIVTGCEWAIAVDETADIEYPKIKPLKAPKLIEKKAAVFYQPGIPAEHLKNLEYPKVKVADLSTINQSDYDAIIVTRNALPLESSQGQDIKKVLEEFWARGKSVIFYGASVNKKTAVESAGLLGEFCGIIDWYQYLPQREKSGITDVKFSLEYPGNPGWNKVVFDDSRWTQLAKLHQPPEYKKGPGRFRAKVTLPKEFENKIITFEMGGIFDSERIYINGVEVADTSQLKVEIPYKSSTDYRQVNQYRGVSRMYYIKPGTPGYQAIKFGKENTIAIEVYARFGPGVMDSDIIANFGIFKAEKAWQGTDPFVPDTPFSSPTRRGVNYWGNQQFFNSWDTKKGMFGFKIEGKGVEFVKDSPLGEIEDLDIEVESCYTDFAVFKPWLYQPLAFTRTDQKLLYPDNGQRYPCAARLVNMETGGEIILIAPALAKKPAGKQILEKLKLR